MKRCVKAEDPCDWKNLPVKRSTRVCSEHLVIANGHLLRPDEVPTPGLPGPVRQNKIRKSHKERSSLCT